MKKHRRKLGHHSTAPTSPMVPEMASIAAVKMLSHAPSSSTLSLQEKVEMKAVQQSLSGVERKGTQAFREEEAAKRGRRQAPSGLLSAQCSSICSGPDARAFVLPTLPSVDGSSETTSHKILTRFLYAALAVRPTV